MLSLLFACIGLTRTNYKFYDVHLSFYVQVCPKPCLGTPCQVLFLSCHYDVADEDNCQLQMKHNSRYVNWFFQQSCIDYKQSSNCHTGNVTKLFFSLFKRCIWLKHAKYVWNFVETVFSLLGTKWAQNLNCIFESLIHRSVFVWFIISLALNQK